MVLKFKRWKSEKLKRILRLTFWWTAFSESPLIQWFWLLVWLYRGTVAFGGPTITIGQEQYGQWQVYYTTRHIWCMWAWTRGRTAWFQIQFDLWVEFFVFRLFFLFFILLFSLRNHFDRFDLMYWCPSMWEK